MKTEPGIVRRVYDAAALFALLNLVVAAGLTGFFAMNGALSGKNVREAVRALRGETCAVPAAAPIGVKTVAGSAEVKPQRVAFDEVELDLMQREAERLRTEVDQRVALAQSIMLRVKAEREKLRQEKEEFAKQEEAERLRWQEAGFQKQLEILTSLSPKMALEHMFAMNDVDKAARILAAMDSDRAKKIVESAKRGEDLVRMKQILERMESVMSVAQIPARSNESP